MKTDRDRIERLEERVSNMMSAMRMLQQQVIMLTRLEKQRSEPLTDPVSEIKRRIVHAAREDRMAKHPIFGDD